MIRQICLHKTAFQHFCDIRQQHYHLPSGWVLNSVITKFCQMIGKVSFCTICVLGPYQEEIDRGRVLFRR